MQASFLVRLQTAASAHHLSAPVKVAGLRSCKTMLSGPFVSIAVQGQLLMFASMCFLHNAIQFQGWHRLYFDMAVDSTLQLLIVSTACRGADTSSDQSTTDQHMSSIQARLAFPCL